jgi:RHS repeat-associated protein
LPRAHWAGYAGYHVDANTGLDYADHRWYDPAVGRWISEDPLGFLAGDTNLVRYVGNAPMVVADPNGEEPVTIAVIALFFFIVYAATANAPAPGDAIHTNDPMGEAIADIPGMVASTLVLGYVMRQMMMMHMLVPTACFVAGTQVVVPGPADGVATLDAPVQMSWVQAGFDNHGSNRWLWSLLVVGAGIAGYRTAGARKRRE